MTRLLTLFLIGFTLVSCNINSNIMLKETKNTEFLPPPVGIEKEYVININDQLGFKFYRNNGFEMLGGTNKNDVEGNTAEGAKLSENTLFTVEQDGMVKMPYIGKVPIVGLTLRQAEAYLEKQYDKIFVQPFIILRVANRRVIVAKGDGSSQVVVLSSNNNISVLEAISMAGGISPRGKAKNIKIIRRTGMGSEIYKLNLSTLDSLELAYIPVQSNDIIYIEPRKNYLQGLTQEISPYITILTAVISVYTASLILSK